MLLCAIHNPPTGKYVWWSTCFYFANKIHMYVLNRYAWKSCLCEKKSSLRRKLYLSSKYAFPYFLLALTWQDVALDSVVVVKKKKGNSQMWGLLWIRSAYKLFSFTYTMVIALKRQRGNWKLGIWFQGHKIPNSVLSSTTHYLDGVGKMCVAGTVSGSIPGLHN